VSGAGPERRAVARAGGGPFVVTAGHPTPEELAALTAVLLTLAARGRVECSGGGAEPVRGGGMGVQGLGVWPGPGGGGG
jgi:hypothetical protein